MVSLKLALFKLRVSHVTVQEFVLLMMAVLASSLGQLFLKIGAVQLGEVTAKNAVNHVLSIVTTPPLIAGLLAYGMGAVFYILVLTRVNLSVAAPSASLIYLFSVLMGYFFFQEALSPARLVGLGLIMAGVVLVASR
jgi:multidrug transporter EmrE-like cation transporter